jgi:hypothetical protein
VGRKQELFILDFGLFLLSPISEDVGKVLEFMEIHPTTLTKQGVFIL